MLFHLILCSILSLTLGNDYENRIDNNESSRLLNYQNLYENLNYPQNELQIAKTEDDASIETNSPNLIQVMPNVRAINDGFNGYGTGMSFGHSPDNNGGNMYSGPNLGPMNSFGGNNMPMAGNGPKNSGGSMFGATPVGSPQFNSFNGNGGGFAPAIGSMPFNPFGGSNNNGLMGGNMFGSNTGGGGNGRLRSSTGRFGGGAPFANSMNGGFGDNGGGFSGRMGNGYGNGGGFSGRGSNRFGGGF